MPYTRPYTGGFKDYPDTTTPINATALNTMDVGIKTANDQFQTVTTAQRTALSPTVGQAVWDSDLKQLMVYMNASGGNAWQPVGNTIICASTTRPASPFAGQRIFETDSKRWWTYIGSAWVPDDMVFTNEAARDSAITAPTEGMVAYLTAPTVPAATGTTTAVPTGITTVYNGSVWVCTTEVAAYSSTLANTTSTSYVTTLTSDSTAISVTLVTGTTAMLTYGALMYGVGGVTNEIQVDFSVSGATTRAAGAGSDFTRALTFSVNGNGTTATKAFVFSGLTAGTNTFTLNYRASSSTANYIHRYLTVKGVA